MATETDLYELLEVERSADDKTIKSSYRRLAMKFHPDKNPGCADSEAKFKAISAAYACLSDPQKRAAYDQYGHAAFQQGGPGGGGGFGGGDFGDLGDIFETIFGGAFGGGRQQARRGADLRYDMEITLEEAFHGKAAEIAVEVAQSCQPCGGSGATPGTSARRCNLCGGHGKVRAQQGFFMVERSCPTCHGRGEVIESPCRACRGEGRVDAQQKLEVAIPAGVDNGTRIRLAGKGEAGPFGAPPGDLYIFLHVSRHRVFEREGTTLLTRGPISITTAALGGQIEIPGLRHLGFSLSGAASTARAMPSTFRRAFSRASSYASAARACRCCRGAVRAISWWKFRSRPRPSFRPASANCCASFRRPRRARKARSQRASSTGSRMCGAT